MLRVSRIAVITVCAVASTAVTAHAQVGACCLDIDDGPLAFDTCTELSSAECATAGGVYQGDDTVCRMQACCLPGGGCQNADVECCLASGGMPQGPQSNCSTLPLCPIVLNGACCRDTDGDSVPDSCVQAGAGQCAAVGGTYHGDGSQCQGSGACCFGITGGACVETDGICCDDVAGSFQGVGTTCAGDANNNGSDDACEVTLACPLPTPAPALDCSNLQTSDCSDDGVNGTCVARAVRVVAVPPGPDVVQVLECGCSDGRCGAMRLDGTTLSCIGFCGIPPLLPDPECQVVVDGEALGVGQVDVLDLAPDSIVRCGCSEACCTSEAAVPCSDRTAASCSAIGGTPLGVGSSCGGPGACCFDIDDGPFAYDTCLLRDEACCIAEGGLFQPGTASCDLQACCLPDGSCTDADPGCCTASGGSPGGAGSACALIKCVDTQGACCFDIDDGPLQYDTCQLTTAAQCAANGGLFGGVGTECDVQACCLPGGFCQETAARCCQASGGFPQGAGSVCGDVNCSAPEGACCFDATGDGFPDSCGVVMPSECQALGGSFKGAGSACLGSGACCFGFTGGACVVVDELCCGDLGGNFRGVGTACAGDSDGDSFDDTCVLCTNAEDCCDSDGDGVRDDNCVWCQCAPDGGCAHRPIDFADAGGNFGDCRPDGFCNIHDRNLVLRCFTDTTSCSPFNIDIGGPFASCCSDGFCNIHDANHALACFAGTSTCVCPGACAAAPEVAPAGSARLRAVAARRDAVAGDTVAVRVFVGDLDIALHSYQLHAVVSGGRQGRLELVDIAIEARRDAVLAVRDDVFSAFNVGTAQMLAGTAGSDPLVDARADTLGPQRRGYLATFTYRFSDDALGRFVVDIRHGAEPQNQTFLIAAGQRAVTILDSAPAVIRVGPRQRAQRRQ